MKEEIIVNIKKDLDSLKVELSLLSKMLCNKIVTSQVIIKEFAKINVIKDVFLPFINFYYDDSDVNGNRVNTYYGYIFCEPNIRIIELVESVNVLKNCLSISIKSLRSMYISNPPFFNKLISSLDDQGRINIKELTRKIVIIDSKSAAVKSISFQLEVTNKGKGRCLTGSEIKYLIDNNKANSHYCDDIEKLKSINSNELLSPIGTERIKCRANISTELELFKGKYCSLPIIIMGKRGKNFKTNISSLFDNRFNKIRSTN